MNRAFDLIATNLSLSFETIVLLLVILAGLIFYSKDVRLGIILHMVATGSLFMWFYELNLNYVPSLICFFIFLILLSLTLYTVDKTVSAGGYV